MGTGRSRGGGAVARTAAAAPALLLALAAGCAGVADLEPAPDAETVATGRGAIEEVAGVTVKAGTDDWPGDPAIRHEVTPLHLRIDNDSGTVLRVAYRDFALIDREGRRYSALPPFQVRGPRGEPPPQGSILPVASPAFLHGGFHVAPYAAPLYPGLVVASYPFPSDPLYGAYYYDYWLDIDLPTPQMLSQALPEGELEDDGYVDGWLYFETVDPGVGLVFLRCDLVDAETGHQLGEIVIPFRTRS